jgi:hypothetical protein
MNGSGSRPSVSRRQFLALSTMATGTAATAAATGTLSPTPAFAGSLSGTDSYSAEVLLMTSDGWYAAPVHSTLLPSGKLLCLGLARPTLTPTTSTTARREAWIMPAPLPAPIPQLIVVSSLSEPMHYNDTLVGSTVVNDDLFCTGQTLTADGRFFTVGGTRQTFNALNGTLESVTGLPYATEFDGQNWIRVPGKMAATGAGPSRWYPTVTSLPDGRLLVTSGFNEVIPKASLNLSVEAYDLTSQSWKVVSPLGHVPPEIVASDYTAAFVLPSAASGYDLVMVGEPGVPVLFSLAGRWSVLNNLPRPGTQAWQLARLLGGGSWDSDTAPDQGASVSMLPLRLKNGDWGYNNGAIMINGSYVGSPWAPDIDVYDVFASSWHTSVTAPVARANPSTVLLPDGHVLVINGHSADPNIGKATLIDPASGFTAVMGTADSGIQRGYHNVATLLPDGSVMVGGGRDLDTPGSYEKPTVQYYYPPYMFADRPQLGSPPSALHYGQTFALAYSGQTPPSDMVLIALGSMTHALDMNQRFLQLDLAGVKAMGSNVYTVVGVGPPNSQATPPGYYLIFMLDSDRLPSKGTIVSLS